MARGRPAEVARLYDQYGPALYRYALMLLGRHDAAEDVLQQVFLALIRGAPELDEPERYLKRAVRNTCYSRLRGTGPTLAPPSAHTERPLLEIVADDQPGTPSPEDRLTLERALLALPPEQREVVHLHVFEGLSFREVAEATGDSPNTVASRYRYALERLRASFQEGRDE